MNNNQIADNFELLAKLMDIHGDNSFKSRSYSTAAYQINQLNQPLSSLTPTQINSLKGIGDAIGKKIQEQLASGQLSLLQEYLQKTPPGIIEMLSIKGLGPKKIATIWKELEIETLGELLYACNENRLTLYKGFGEKTQKNIREAIEFYLQHQGQFLFAEIDPWAQVLLQKLVTNFPHSVTLAAGTWRRQMEIIPYLTLVTTIPSPQLQQQLNDWEFTIGSVDDKGIECTSRAGIQVQFIFSNPDNLYRLQFELSADNHFMEKW
ncbi:MAG: helix-hairpin-helix domain-containing protein, partial [Sediminibacterium sp.]